MKTALLLSLSHAALAGCSVAARSPEMYRDDTTKVLAAKSDDIRACYDGVLKGTPGASGKVTVKFDVPKDGEQNAGKISNVTVDAANTTAPPAVADCVTNRVPRNAERLRQRQLLEPEARLELSAPDQPPQMISNLIDGADPV